MADQPNNDALLTPAEVAALFRVNPKTVTRWARAGKITAIRTLGGPPSLPCLGDPPLPRADGARGRLARVHNFTVVDGTGSAPRRSTPGFVVPGRLTATLGAWLVPTLRTPSASASSPTTHPACSAGWRRPSARRAGTSPASTSWRSVATAWSATSRCSPSTRPTSSGIRAVVDAVDGRRGRQRPRPHVPHARGRQDRDPFEDPAAEPRRPVDGLHAGRRPRLQGDRRDAERGPQVHDQGEHRRHRHRRHRRARPRRHRARGRRSR